MTSTTETRPVGTPPGAPPPAPPKRSMAAVTVGLVLVAVGVLALLATLGVDIPMTVVGPVALLVLGVGVIASAVRGEPAGGVMAVAVVLGVLLALGSMVGALLNVPLRGGIGDRTHQPQAAAELEDEYHLLIGQLVLDLRETDLGPGTTEVDVSTAIGQVEVRLPDDVAVSVDSEVGGGSAVVLGRQEDGLGVDNDVESDGYANADQRLLLHVGVGLGEVRVTR